MDSLLVTHSFQKWLKAVISIGNTLTNMAQNPVDRELSSTYEHFFVIAVGKSLEWGAELKGIDDSKYQSYCNYKENIPEARLARNMREHDVAYIKGEGHHQQEFIKTLELDINNESISASVDGTSTIICNEGYLIGGRLNVQGTVAHAEKSLKEI